MVTKTEDGGKLFGLFLDIVVFHSLTFNKRKKGKLRVADEMKHIEEQPLMDV